MGGYDHFFPNKPSKSLIEQLALLCQHDKLKRQENCIPGLSRYKLASTLAEEISIKFLQLPDEDKQILLYARVRYQHDRWKEFVEEHSQKHPEDKQLLADIEERLLRDSTVESV